MKLQKFDYGIALVFLFGTLLIHWPAQHAGFVADFWGWEREYRSQSFWAFLHTFGHPVHQQVPQFFNILFYKLFGTWGFPWYLLFCTIHAINGFLIYRLFLKISNLWKISNGNWLGITAALFFLFSPYVPDVTVWRVCLHYLLSGLFTLGALYGMADYLERRNKRALWLAHGLLLLNFFTLEMALAIPLLTHAFCIGWLLTRPEGFGKSISLGNFFRQISVPQLAICSFFFLLNKLSFGQWVGHYGEATHLKFDLAKMFGQSLKYASKYAVFGRHFEHKDKAKLFGFFEDPKSLLWSYGIIVLAIGIALLYKRRAHPRFSLGLLLFVLGLIATFPVSNLHFEWILFNELDRYGYLASIFFLGALATLFSAVPGNWKNIPAFSFLLISVFFLSKSLFWWRDMDNCYKKLLRDFQWYDKKEIFILASADNLKGIWLFRSYRDKPALQYALELQENKALDIQFHEIAQYNMNSLQEAVTASIPDSTNGLIKVEFDQWGNWWWRHGKGANNYENDLFKVDFKGKWYELSMKKEHPDALFIYQSGDSWKILGQ